MNDSPLRILLVEDNTGDAALLELALVESHYGRFEVVHVRRLSEAISDLAVQVFHAILLDLGLPDSQGLETLARMKSKAGAVPIIVLTGLADESLALSAMQQGAQDYLVKSEVDRGLVARAVRYVIERTRAVRASQEAERRLELAVNAAQIGIWEWDVQTDKVIWSPILARVLGVEGGERNFDTFEQWAHPEDRAETLKLARDALAQREAFHHEYRVNWPDGSVHWVEGRGRGFYDENDLPLRMMGTVVDISQRKAAEEVAKKREADMAHLSRVSTMGQMASGLAHELNQPLGAILNYAGVALAQLEGESGTKQLAIDAVREVMNETRRADAIIKRMREFVRKHQPQSQAVDMNAIVQRSLKLMEFELRRWQIGVETQLAPDLPVVMADPVQIEQVLVNLVYNAAEAMGECAKGLGRVTIRTALESVPSQVRLTVSDTGPGIAPENLKRLFEPFFSTKTKGLGMGLNISRSIVESHGGRLSAAAGTQGGVQFTFTIPIESDGVPCPTSQMH